MNNKIIFGIVKKKGNVEMLERSEYNGTPTKWLWR